MMYCPDCTQDLTDVPLDQPCPNCGGDRRGATALLPPLAMKGTLAGSQGVENDTAMPGQVISVPSIVTTLQVHDARHAHEADNVRLTQTAPFLCLRIEDPSDDDGFWQVSIEHSDGNDMTRRLVGNDLRMMLKALLDDFLGPEADDSSDQR